MRHWVLISLLTFAVIHWNLGRRAHTRHGDRKKPLVALTFDDGPNPPFTEEIAWQLYKLHVPSTFFLIGQHIRRFPETVQKLKDWDHEIANHSFSHPPFAFASWSTLEKEINDTDSLIREYQPGIPWIRSPFGRIGPLFTWWLNMRGRRNVLFDVKSDPPDYTRPSPEEIVESVVERTRNGSIIDLHDGEGNQTETLMAVNSIVQNLRARGFEFVTVTDLLQ